MNWPTVERAGSCGRRGRIPGGRAPRPHAAGVFWPETSTPVAASWTSWPWIPGPPARLVVVEVRWRRSREFGLPEETFDSPQARACCGAASPASSRPAPAGRLGAAASADRAGTWRCVEPRRRGHLRRASASGCQGAGNALLALAGRRAPARPVSAVRRTWLLPRLPCQPCCATLRPGRRMRDGTRLRRPQRGRKRRSHAEPPCRERCRTSRTRAPPGSRQERCGGSNRRRSVHAVRFDASSCWRPASISATRPAAGIPRCARSSSRSATGSTSSTSPRP